MTEITEEKFSNWCKKRKWFCKKFMTHTKNGHGNSQESDFLVANFESVYFVEIKERHGDLFDFEDLTQERKLKLASKKTDKIKIRILLHFIEHDCIILMNLKEYIDIKSNSKFINGKDRKSLNIKQIPSKYKYTWKNLKL